MAEQTTIRFEVIVRARTNGGAPTDYALASTEDIPSYEAAMGTLAAMFGDLAAQFGNDAMRALMVAFLGADPPPSPN